MWSPVSESCGAFLPNPEGGEFRKLQRPSIAASALSPSVPAWAACVLGQEGAASLGVCPALGCWAGSPKGATVTRVLSTRQDDQSLTWSLLRTKTRP